MVGSRFIPMFDLSNFKNTHVMKTKKKVIRLSHSKEPYFREVEARVFEIDGVQLALNPRNEHWEFTHVESGLGFNGDGSRTVKGIEQSITAIEKRMGKAKMWKNMKVFKPLDERIAEQKQDAIDAVRRKKDWQTLSKTLGFTPPLCGITTWASGKVSLDVFKLENRLKQKFDMKDKSMSEVITENYGKDTAAIVESLL